jgi:hypothetical protein
MTQWRSAKVSSSSSSSAAAATADVAATTEVATVLAAGFLGLLLLCCCCCCCCGCCDGGIVALTVKVLVIESSVQFWQACHLTPKNRSRNSNYLMQVAVAAAVSATMAPGAGAAAALVLCNEGIVGVILSMLNYQGQWLYLAGVSQTWLQVLASLHQDFGAAPRTDTRTRFKEAVVSVSRLQLALESGLSFVPAICKSSLALRKAVAAYASKDVLCFALGESMPVDPYVCEALGQQNRIELLTWLHEDLGYECAGDYLASVW